MACLKEIVLYASNYSYLATMSGSIGWMGEGAEYSHGGINNVTNTFTDSFYYVYQLCELLQNGIQGTARSTLVGGSYELIDTNTHIPNPDYWILYIWSQLIGNKMFESRISFINGINDDYIRGYSLEAKQDNKQYVVVLINFHLTYSVILTIEMEMNNNKTYEYEEYVLKGIGFNGLQTKSISVNNQVMQYKNGKFPILKAQNATNMIELPPASIRFVVIKPVQT
eukprot:UN05739